MFDDHSNLSSDLEWMLSSTQADPAEVRQAVVLEHGLALYSLAVSLLVHPALASGAFVEVIAHIPDNRQRYSAQTGVKNWLYTLMVEVCRRYRLRKQAPWYWRRISHGDGEHANPGDRYPVVKRAVGVNHQVWQAVDRLGEELRTPLLLSFVHHLPIADISRILHLKEAEVNQRLLRARRKLHQRLRSRLCQLRVEEGHRSPFNWEHLRARELALAKLSGIPLTSTEMTSLNEHLRNCPACRAYLVELGELEILLESSLSSRLLASQPNLPTPAKLLSTVEESLDQRRKRSGLWVPLQRIALAGTLIALVLFLGGLTNRLFPRSAAFLPEVVAVTRVVQVRIRVTQMVSPTPFPTPQPLNEHSTVAEIRSRMVMSSRFWQSLWADALVLRYGPAGYIGPPQVYRNQVWIDQPEKMMVLSGDLARAENVTFKLYNNIYEMDLRNGLTYFYEEHEQTYQRLYGPPLAFPNLADTNLRRLVDGSLVQRLISPQWIGQQVEDLRVVGLENLSSGKLLIVAGIVDGSPSFRIWLDPQTGVPLRWQRFDKFDPSAITEEVILNQLVYGVPFPERSYSDYFFSPERFQWDNEWKPDPDQMHGGWFAWAPAPGRNLSDEATQRSSDQLLFIKPSAPWQSNLSQSHLTFRWDFHWNRGREVENSSANLVPGRFANLFSGPYFLGRAELGNPWSLVCRRSPDGQLITYNEGWSDPFQLVIGARWLDLRNPEEAHLLLPEGSLTGGDAAFSPDSRSLAFWGCGGNDNNCGVYIQDLQTQKNRKLNASMNSAFFQWSPDGQYLAMIRLLYPAGQPEPLPRLVVLRVSNGGKIYEGDYDWERKQAQEDAPILTWGIPFPPDRTGLEGCIAAPYKGGDQ